MDAVAQSLRNPGSAKYHWAKFPAVVTEGSVNYCATVDAQSPYAAYNGRQAYVVEAQISGNRVSSAVVGLVAGGKDFALVTKQAACSSSARPQRPRAGLCLLREDEPGRRSAPGATPPTSPSCRSCFASRTLLIDQSAV